MKNILIIQTAFIGDVILATPILSALKSRYPDAAISFLVRKGNESLLRHHPHVKEVLVWDKTEGKYLNLLKVATKVRKLKFDAVFNLHRFGTSGFITWFSGAGYKVGFNKNPFSFCYTRKVNHEVGNGKHEIERNLELVSNDLALTRPEIQVSAEDEQVIWQYRSQPFVCVAPASVWFTKQFPAEGWVKLCQTIDREVKIYLLGSPADSDLCNRIAEDCERNNVVNLAGKLSLLQSAALMKYAAMNYVNDSAPMHLASAMNAPVAAVFCSTVPNFGFGPVSDQSHVIETTEKLDCRPCGLHGHGQCPEGHFKCATTINAKQFPTP
ncbi:MAG: glycosyltransferase family 9 protein [Cryomorphaceae bacterium]|nr:MAG: glycosyltransferase family 9 protein [Cryomorphaceae bacterium]